MATLLSVAARVQGTVLVLAAMLAGCTNLPAGIAPATELDQRVRETLNGSAVFGRPVSANELPHHDILKVDPQMAEFVARHTGSYRTRSKKIRELLRALLTPGLVGIQYNEGYTLTAEKAFKAQQANCLAFSNLFIALAREAGLNAYYQDVLVAPEWDLKAGSMTLRRHVNVLIEVNRFHSQVIDLSRERYDLVELETKPLTDEQAFAQYYNNLAMDSLYEKDYQQAYLYALKALQLDRRAAFIWSNLGVILSRLDKLDHAEAALLQAIQYDSGEQAAMVNLAALYRARGAFEQALELEKRVARYRARNPYYLLASAKEAYQHADYAAALGLLSKALALKNDEALLFAMLSQTHAAMGQHDKAVSSLHKAIRMADTDTQRNNYRARLDELLANLGNPQATQVNEEHESNSGRG